jgi:hypothetical protein
MPHTEAEEARPAKEARGLRRYRALGVAAALFVTMLPACADGPEAINWLVPPEGTSEAHQRIATACEKRPTVPTGSTSLCSRGRLKASGKRSSAC